MANVSFLTPKSLSKAHKRTNYFLRKNVSLNNHGVSSNNHEPSLPPSNFLSGVPFEIKQHILTMLPDIASLKALMLACPSFYQVFCDRKSYVLVRILNTYITPDLMCDALATFQSTPRLQWSKKKVNDLILRYTNRETNSLLPEWNHCNATALVEMHGHVQFFANGIANSALSHVAMTGLSNPNPVKASPSELIRIQRTLYRFQFYCNMYNLHAGSRLGRFNIAVRDEQGDRVFHGFAPWENQQLACIRDFLCNVMSEGKRSFQNTAKRLAAANSSSYT